MGRRLTFLSNGGSEISYDYDASGQRISKAVNGITTDFYYDDRGALILLSCEDGTGLYFYPEADGSIGSIGINGNRYYYVRNAQNDIIGITDKTGAFVARYTYDEWGVITSITDGNGNDVSGNPNHIANLNPLRYRSYFYDTETGWYWLNTRYYNPVVGRFINADGYVSTGQDITGYNMFAYCGNNPINRMDPNGAFWKDIGDFFENIWNGVKTWANNTFGAGCSTTTVLSDNEEQIIPDPSPVTLSSGTQITQTISEYGDSSKPISVYANKNSQHPFKSSTAGANINIGSFTLDLSLGFDNIGISGSLANGDTSSSFGLRLNLAEFKIGFESSTSITFTTTTKMTLTIVFGDSDSKTNIKIDGEKQETSTKILVIELEAGTHTITKADSTNVFYISLE